jgi:SNF2 family DNA or RNA helicase
MRTCTICGSTDVKVDSRVNDALYMVHFNCGHVVFMGPAIPELSAPEAKEEDSFTKCMPFQKEGIEFLEQILNDPASPYMRGIIADDPGLGKTVQALVFLARNWDKLTPCLIVVPPGLTVQWYHFCLRWLSKDQTTPLPVWHSGKDLPMIKGFKLYIIGSNLIEAPYTMDSIRKMGFQFAIFDEAHNYANTKSARSQALLEITRVPKAFEARTEPYIKNVLFLTGTAIVNKITDYFTIFNICAPNQFRSRYDIEKYCSVDTKGKALGLLPYHQEYFKKLTSKFMIHRLKSDVLTDLPEFTRDFDSGWIAPTNKKMAGIYNDLLDELETALDDEDESAHVIAIISRMRKLVGEIKALEIANRVYDGLMESEDPTSKITVGVHHHEVTKLLLYQFEKRAREDGINLPILTMNGRHSVIEKQRIEDEFRKPENRILIASTIAAGEGRNMQFCNQFALAEREWNPALEEQFEARFWRKGQEKPVYGVYYQLHNTIDMWLHELVELKRQVILSASTNEIVDNVNLIREIAIKALRYRMKVVR